jgi:hypothetical protein
MNCFGLAGISGLILVLGSNAASAQEALQPPPTPATTPAEATVGPATAPVEAVSGSDPAKLRASGPTVWGGVGYWGLYGIGASYMMPVANGVLKHPTIRDQFMIEFGADYLRRSYGWITGSNYTWNEIVPMVGVAWMVWLKQNLAVYPKADVGYALGWLSGFDCNGCSEPSYGGVFINGSVGVLYDLGSVVLRGELGNELAKGGVAFLF